MSLAKNKQMTPIQHKSSTDPRALSLVSTHPTVVRVWVAQYMATTHCCGPPACATSNGKAAKGSIELGELGTTRSASSEELFAIAIIKAPFCRILGCTI